MSSVVPDCPCTSMNPGLTMRPVASITVVAVAADRSPRATMRSPFTPMSPRVRGEPRPSITSPPFTSRSNFGADDPQAAAPSTTAVIT